GFPADQFHGDGRRSPARPQVIPAERTGRHVRGSLQRLDEQPIESGIAWRVQGEGGEIDAPVPAHEQLIELRQLSKQAGRKRHAGCLRPRQEPCVNLSVCHADRKRPTYEDKTATAAGVTPGMREACPSVAGRIWKSRCTTSRDSPGTRSKGKSEGMTLRSAFRARSIWACS